jgi:hypothetical protein
VRQADVRLDLIESDATGPIEFDTSKRFGEPPPL